MGKSEREKWEEMKKSMQQEQDSDQNESLASNNFNAREKWNRIKASGFQEMGQEIKVDLTPKPAVPRAQKKEVTNRAEVERVSHSSSAKKKYLIAIAVIAAVLIAVAVMLPENVKDALRVCPDGVKLIDESWDNGVVKVIALDETTLWIRITDDRPDQEYEDLGTPWEIDLTFGDEIYWNENYGDDGVHEFYITLRSLADRALLINEYEQGDAADYRDSLQNLFCVQYKKISTGGFTDTNKNRKDFLDIVKGRNTYTAVITLPEWFDVSASEDLVRVDVYLRDKNFWKEICEEGRSSSGRYFTFSP